MENTKIEWATHTQDLWHKKTAAKRIGINLDEYIAKLGAGLKWCTSCKSWHERSVFVSDRSRKDGLASYCSDSRSTGNPIGWHERPATNPLTGRPGPAPHPARENDKTQARQRINLEVRSGRMPRPNTLPCTDCGHIHSKGTRRHEYDHYLGYAAVHHLHVQAVCSMCHSKRDNASAKKTHCKRGHELAGDNLYRPREGGRACRECMRIHERNRPPRGSEYWRKVNIKRGRSRG